ncbi:MAG: MFS transporter [Rhodobacteraceae bacterium]|nr:MFS transporter [Paracoccaceae bacterium]
MSARLKDTHRDFGLAGLRGRLIAILTSLVTASVLMLGLAVILAFDRAVEPEIANRTRLIGSVIRGEIQRALELGIPINAVAGLDIYLADALGDFEEVERIAVTDVKGNLVTAVDRPDLEQVNGFFGLGIAVAFREQSFQLPILEGNRLVGTIEVEVSPRFVQTKLRNVFLDVGVLALVAVLIAVELSLWVVVSSVGKPMDRMLRLLKEQQGGKFHHQIRVGGIGGLSRMAVRLNDHVTDMAERLARLPDKTRTQFQTCITHHAPARLRLSNFNDIRLALFLFALGTEIAAAFMPLYAKAASRPDWLSADFAAAFPLVFYLGAIALVSPFGSALIRRFGARKMFLAAAPGGGVALTGLALSSTIWQITFFQGVMAGFYAIASIAGQEYAIRAADEKDRAKAVGAFVAVAYGGLFAGSALGGLIAGRFGFEAAFVTGAILAALSIFLGLSSMRGRAGDRVDPNAKIENQTPGSAVRSSWINGRYLALLFGVAVPMNVTMVVYIWYLTPLMLSDLGSGPAEIARVLVLYNIAFFLLGPTVARLADGRTGPMIPLMTGASILGFSLLSLMLWSGFWAVAVAVTGVGIGQVLMQTPIFAMALKINGGPGRGIDALRLIERLGAIAGLVVGAVLLGRVGAGICLQVLGIAVLAGITIYSIVEFRANPERERRVTET